MLKRHLDVENKENEPEQSLLKYADTNEPTPAKRAKIIDTEIAQDLEVSSDEEDDEDNGPLPISSVIENEPEQSLLKSTDTNEPNPAKRAKIIDTEMFQEPTGFSSDEEDDEDKGPWPISSVIENNPGTISSTNKQYFVYENTEPTMISITARFWSRKYLKVLRHVDPDAYDMYIHNDFVSYGELEIIENCLIDIAKGTFVKHKNQMNFTHYVTAFRRLEALNIVLDCCNNFVGIDDGGRFVEIIRVIGACYVTILSGLLPKSIFDIGLLSNDDMKKFNKISQQLPNFQEVIKRALILGRMLLSIGSIPSAYTKILQIIYCNWSLIVNQVRIDLNEKPHEKDEDLWDALKHAARIRHNAYNESFNFISELDLYSKNNPDLGGNSHDLRKWSKTRRNMYLFDNMDADADEPVGDFWFRL